MKQWFAQAVLHPGAGLTVPTETRPLPPHQAPFQSYMRAREGQTSLTSWRGEPTHQHLVGSQRWVGKGICKRQESFPIGSGSQTFQHQKPLFKNNTLSGPTLIYKTKQEKSFILPTQAYFYPFYGGSGAAFSGHFWSSSFIRSGPFWWHCIAPCLTFDKSQGMSAYSKYKNVA